MGPNTTSEIWWRVVSNSEKEKTGTRNLIAKKISLIRGVNRESNPGPHQIQILHSYKNISKIPNGAWSPLHHWPNDRQILPVCLYNSFSYFELLFEYKLYSARLGSFLG